LCANADRPLHWTVAASETEQVEHDEPVAGRHEGNDVAPEVARRGEAMEEDDRISGATRAGGIVVDPCAVEIEKLTAHASARLAWGREDDGFRADAPLNAKRAATGVTARFVFRELRWIVRAT